MFSHYDSRDELKFKHICDMKRRIIRNGIIINEYNRVEGDISIVDGRIEAIGQVKAPEGRVDEIDANGCLILPGVIDDQVHFREPGLTHKANIATESRAAVAGGVTSYMEMPNTKPPAVTQSLLQAKYDIASKTSSANYSFYMGASNDNLEEVLKTDGRQVCGIKAFMGSSTGNMLVDDPVTLEKLFSKCPLLIATHCEDEETVRQNEQNYKEKYGEKAPSEIHPLIRSVEACYLSSSFAVNLARQHQTRLHILHLTTEKELSLFDKEMDRAEKLITSEVCVHHLSFSEEDYLTLGNKIKCNPAIKTKQDQDALWEALIDGRIDVIATDHAPHTVQEKAQSYFNAPSGLPLVQHPLLLMMDHAHRGKISPEMMVDKMSHAVADLFRIVDRGYIREGYFADLVLVDPSAETFVEPSSLYYKCGWSPLEGRHLKGRILYTFVNGDLAYDGDTVLPITGQRLTFKGR